MKETKHDVLVGELNKDFNFVKDYGVSVLYTLGNTLKLEKHLCQVFVL